MNTFEKHFQHYPLFIEHILAWRPDFLVPVAKKGCKLIKTLEDLPQLKQNPDLIKYRTFFELSNCSVHGKKVAIVDDATQYTATLQEYRRYFENLGATVRTYSFVGHEDLTSGTRWKEDPLAEISRPLPEAVYQEYILQQSYYLLSEGKHFDLDHLVFELRLKREELGSLLDFLRTQGELLDLEDYFLQSRTKRFTLNQPRFFGTIPFLQTPYLSYGPIRKIKFAYDASREILHFSPLLFPTWEYRKEDVAAPIFQLVPFSLPYKLPNFLDRRNRGALLRVYYNMYFVCAVSLAKAFIQSIHLPQISMNTLAIIRNDLDAVLGVRVADDLILSIRTFICNADHYDFGFFDSDWKKPRSPVYSSFEDVINVLKAGYEKNTIKARSRVGVHYLESYESLFRQCSDPIRLSEDIDYFCDFGIIVPEIFTQRGRLVRGCRTGEPDAYYNWKRTQLLIPLAIDQFCAENKRRTKAVAPTVLNKLLANFIYDYPSEIYHELHCLIGYPYLYGTFVGVYHRVRAPHKRNLYEAEKISPYFMWDEQAKNFHLLDRKKMIGEVSASFDERQEVPYSEIVTFFKLMSRIYHTWESVDILNMLSICREENCFYNHILWNIRASLAEYGTGLDYSGDERRSQLRSALSNARSAHEKLRLARLVDGSMEKIEKRFGRQVEFIKTVELLKKHYTPFSTSFRSLMDALSGIVVMEMILATIGLLLLEDEEFQRVSELRSLDVIRVMKDANIAVGDRLEDLVREKEVQERVCEILYTLIAAKLDGLPIEEPMLSARLQNEARQRAKNVATSYVYKTKLAQITLLYVDLSGLRNIPEPKEDVLSRYYQIVEKAIERRGGQKLYGGKGGDDMYTVLFTSNPPAFVCAREIKADCKGDLFLHAFDVKYGLSFAIFTGDQKEEEIIRCWGNAKDCCEYKGNHFRNRGDLLVSQNTYEALESQHGTHLKAKLIAVPEESLRDGQAIYRYTDIG